MTKTNRTQNRNIPITKVLFYFQKFAKAEASSGILLFLCALVAMFWANSSFASSYTSLWQTPITVGISDWALTKPLLLWINDGLMAIFFFVVGLEIKRELLVGELSSLRMALFPIVAAIGGVLLPAGIYLIVNIGSEGINGWGIPMATDIAFGLGVLALLSKRIPASLSIFLMALAIIDDLIAVLVIVIFYSTQIEWTWLLIGTGWFCSLIASNIIGIRYPLVYTLLGFGLWFCFLKSGVHATIAGVLVAMTIPAKNKINWKQFIVKGRRLLDEFISTSRDSVPIIDNPEQRAVLGKLETAYCEVLPPLLRLENGLHPWVAFFIMPLFALANAGVAISDETISSIFHPTCLGVLMGAILGKQIGITLFSYVSVKLGIADKPSNLSWWHIYSVSWIAGIGFTMSIFIANLAFDDNVQLLNIAKIGVLTASLLAGVIGWIIFRLCCPKVEQS